MTIKWRKILNYTSIVGAIAFGLGLLLLLIANTIIKRYYLFDNDKYITYVDKINKELLPYTKVPRKFQSLTKADEFKDSVFKNTDSIFYFASNVQVFLKTRDAQSVFLDTAAVYNVKIDTLTQDELSKIKELANYHYANWSDLEKKLTAIVGKEFVSKYSVNSSNAYSSIDHSETVETISYYFLAGIFLTIISFPFLSFLREKAGTDLQIKLFDEAKQRSLDNPEAIKPSWDMAQLTLEQYFQRNLKQINMIFKVSVLVMIVGFALIAIGVVYAIHDRSNTSIQIVSVGSGILTEFIGATFIFIYNSTIKQAITYTDSLEQINSVGMSIKILDSIKLEDGNKDNLNNAKIEIAKMLIQKSQAK